MLGSFLRKLIPQNVAGIIGLVQSIITTARELVMLVIRLLAIFMPERFSESMISGIGLKIDFVNGWIEKGKSFFLKVGK